MPNSENFIQFNRFLLIIAGRERVVFRMQSKRKILIKRFLKITGNLGLSVFPCFTEQWLSKVI
jgi:hypothetical protein